MASRAPATAGGSSIASLAEVPGAPREASAGVAARAWARLWAAPPALPSPALLLQGPHLLADAGAVPADRSDRV